MPEVSEKDAMVDLEQMMESTFLRLFGKKYRVTKRESYVEKGHEMDDLLTPEAANDGRETGAISKRSTQLIRAAESFRDADGFPQKMIWPRHPAPPVPDRHPNRGFSNPIGGPNSNPPIMGASYVANSQHVKMEYLPDPPLF